MKLVNLYQIVISSHTAAQTVISCLRRRRRRHRRHRRCCCLHHSRSCFQMAFLIGLPLISDIFTNALWVQCVNSVTGTSLKYPETRERGKSCLTFNFSRRVLSSILLFLLRLSLSHCCHLNFRAHWMIFLSLSLSPLDPAACELLCFVRGNRVQFHQVPDDCVR